MKQMKSYTIGGIFFVLILGSFSHFFYEWSGNNPIIGLFSPVNESIWEHMKLIFFPMLLYSFVTVPMLRNNYPCVGPAYLAGIIIGTLLVPVIFYTYTGILGFNILALDIVTFVLSVVIAFFVTYRLALACNIKSYSAVLYGIVILMLISFMVFSYFPPNIGLFRDSTLISK